MNRADARAGLVRMAVRAAAKAGAIWQEIQKSSGHGESRGCSDCDRRAASAARHRRGAIPSGRLHNGAGPGPWPQPGPLPPPEQYKSYEQADAGTARWLRRRVDREQRNGYRLQKRRQAREFRLQALALLVDGAVRIAAVAAPIAMAGLATVAIHLLGPVIGTVTATIHIGIIGSWWRRRIRRRGHPDRKATAPGTG